MLNLHQTFQKYISYHCNSYSWIWKKFSHWKVEFDISEYFRISNGNSMNEAYFSFTKTPIIVYMLSIKLLDRLKLNLIHEECIVTKVSINCVFSLYLLSCLFHFKYIRNWPTEPGSDSLKTDITKKLISQELKHILRSCEKHWKASLLPL